LSHLSTHLCCAAHLLHLHSFPTRRSSDLEGFFTPATDEHVTQLGREVRTFTQQRVAANAVVLLPDQFPAHHRLGHRLLVGARWYLFLCVVGQAQEHQDEEKTSSEVDVPGHALCEGL